MSHDKTVVKVTGEDGRAITIDVAPREFEVRTVDESLRVKVGWCKDELREDYHGYGAVAYAWPGVTSLSLSKPDGDEPFFEGQVTGKGYGSGHIYLEADQGDGGEPGPDPLTLVVSADETDPEQLTVLVVADNAGLGEVSLDWGDGSPAETNPGDGQTPSSHVYAAGTFLIRAAGVADPSRTAEQTVTVPFPLP